jgi:cytochrome c-type biogenesis protein CcsB
MLTDLSFGLNEPTLTSLAYFSYLVAFLLYATYLTLRSPSAVAVRSRGVALAGASSAGTVEVGSGGTPSERAGRLNGSSAPLFGRLATGFVILAWVSMTGALAIRWVEAGRPPWVTLYEVLTSMVWGTTTIYLLLFEGVLKTKAAGVFSVLILFCIQSYTLWFIPADLQRPIELVPALRSNWLLIHVSTAIIAYSAFAVAAGAGLTILAKHHMKNRMTASLPSEAAIEEFMFRAVAIGFPFQTLLLITGAIWAQEAWTKAWSWDPKETWALVTWLTYAAYLHVRVNRGVRGVSMAWLSVVGFMVVLFTLMGVNYLVEWFGITSMHTYNKPAGRSLDVMGIALVLMFVTVLAMALFSWLRLRFPWQKKRESEIERRGSEPDTI